MKRFLKCLFIAFLGGVTVSANAAKVDSVPEFLRSSIYTILIHSDAQDKSLDAEVTQQNNEYLAIAESFTTKEKTEEDNIPKSQLVRNEFLNIPIPDQFNDHNLDLRFVRYEEYINNITAEDLAAAGLNKVSNKIEDMIPVVMNRVIDDYNLPENMLAKWFSYDPDRTTGCYDDQLVRERLLYAASEIDKAEAKMQSDENSALERALYDRVLNNTFLLVINTRYLNDQAIFQEAQAAANAIGSLFGDLGTLAAQVGGAIAGGAVGDAYSVQTLVYLYKMEWNEEIKSRFYEEYWDKSLEELQEAGFCKLTLLGSEKAHSRVSQAITSKKPLSQLVRRASARAIDATICKLQKKFEVFRTNSPITEVDEEAKLLYAPIGMKEGVEPGDEYEVLEEIYDEATGATSYKSIATVKPVKGKIWDNRYGAAEEVQEEIESGAKNAEKNASAVELGRTAFKCGKIKNVYPGMLLRLKKKK